MGPPIQKSNHEFNSEWIKYYEWVVPVEDNKFKAHCTLCNLTLHVSSMGHFALLQHEKSRKHRNNWIQNIGEYWYGTNNYASTQSRIMPIEYPYNTEEIYLDASRVKIETIDDDDDSSVEIVSPSNPQAAPVVRNADISPNLLVTSTDLSSRYQSNLPNCNSTIESPSKRMDNVKNTEPDDGSRSDLPESNGFSENNSKLTHSDARKNSSPELLDSITSRAADSPPNRGQSVSPAHNDDNVADASVSQEPSQTGTTMEKSSSYPSIPSSSDDVEQALQNVEMIFEIGSSYPSVPSPPTAMEQTPQNAEMIFEIDSNSLTTPTAMEETHQNVEMALKKGIDYPPTSGISTAILPTERSTELPLDKSGICPSTPGPFTGPNEKRLSVLLDRYSEPSSRNHEGHFPHSNNYHMFRRLSAASEAESAQHSSTRQTPRRVHSPTKDKSYLKNEVRSIFERLDEAKRVYESKCRIIMEDYKILLNKFSQESDPTFQPSDILMPEYASAWNSLKLLKILLSEENSSEKPENKQNTIDSRHGNGSNYDGNFSRNQPRVFSRGHGFSHISRGIRKRGRPRKQKVWELFGNEKS